MARPLRYNPTLYEQPGLTPRPRAAPGVDAEERWEDIQGWEGYYQISDHGRVLAVERELWWNKASGITKVEPESMLAPTSKVPLPGRQAARCRQHRRGVPRARAEPRIDVAGAERAGRPPQGVDSRRR